MLVCLLFVRSFISRREEGFDGGPPMEFPLCPRPGMTRKSALKLVRGSLTIRAKVKDDYDDNEGGKGKTLLFHHRQERMMAQEARKEKRRRCASDEGEDYDDDSEEKDDEDGDEDEKDDEAAPTEEDIFPPRQTHPDLGRSTWKWRCPGKR